MILLKNKIFTNSIWMMLEKLVSMLGVIFVNSYMAKYVGPENFGKIVYASSFFVFVQSLSWYGGQNLYLKRMSQNRISGIKLAFSNLKLRNSILYFSSFLILVYLYFFSDLIVFVFGLANFLASYYLINDYYALYNNSQLKSNINALSNIFGLVVALFLRAVFVYFEISIYYMSIPIIILALVPYYIRKFIFDRYVFFNVKSIEVQKYNKYFLKVGSMLLISSFSIVIYTQISNIFLVNYSSFDDLGLYNVAMTLGASWTFINIALITSFFSKIYKLKNSKDVDKYIYFVSYLIFFVYFFVSLFLSLFGDWIILTLYGQDYIKVGDLLLMMVFGTFLSAMNTIYHRYLMKFNGYRYLSIKMIFVGLLSIPISYIFISKLGLYGAVYFYVLIELISLTIANYFFRNAEIFFLQLSFFNFTKNLKSYFGAK